MAVMEHARSAAGQRDDGASVGALASVINGVSAAGLTGRSDAAALPDPISMGASGAAGRAALARRNRPTTMPPRLGQADWILAGFQALIAHGPEAVRVEPLARAVGATKGSFYWHFRDLSAVHQAMLAAWEGLASTAITSAARRPDLSAAARIYWLCDRLAELPEEEQGGAALEPAIRDWGRSHAGAQAALARVDHCRILDLTQLFADADLQPKAAEQAALVFYAALIGLESLRRSTGVALLAPLRAVAAALLAPVVVVEDLAVENAG